MGFSVIGSSFEKGVYRTGFTQSCWVGTTFSQKDSARKGWVYGTLISNFQQIKQSVLTQNSKLYETKECVTLWPCHLHLNVSSGKKTIMEMQIFHHAKMKSSKHPLKETKILQDIRTLHLISIFNTSQNIIFQKSSQKNRPITQGTNSFELLYYIMNLNTISLPWQAKPTKFACCSLVSLSGQGFNL